MKNVFDLSGKVAIAVGIGSNFIDKKAIEEERYEVLTERAYRLTSNFRQAMEKIKK